MHGEWAKYGIDSGAALHRLYYGYSWAYDGLVALGAFSMRLRSERLVHYFTVLDTHIVLDFLYDAYESRLQYKWLDARFNDTKHYAPRLKANFYLDMRYPKGEETWYYLYSD